MEYINEADILIPKRKEGSHKGDNGRVLLIGGSKEYAGAVALAGIAALRSGADMVVVAAPEKVAWAINTIYPDLITVKLKGEYIEEKHLKTLLELAKKSDAVLIGNGIGLNKGTQKLVKAIVKSVNKPIVIDADAIKAIRLNDIKNAILTPHKKEYEIFLVNSKLRESQAKRLLGNNVIVLKGRIDEIITAKKTYYNKTGNAGMTVGGTGDILAGLCAGFVSQGLSLTLAAIDATYFSGYAGDNLKEKKGYTYIASDVAEEIIKVRKKFSKH
jgi:NAD(P)H-hydrate epimerase